MLLALVVVACGSPLGGSLGTQLRVATPRFSIEPGTYNEDILVEVATTTADATIYVTTDGTDPLVSGEPYGGPITVAGDGTVTDIRAYALRDGMQRSGVIRGVFEIAYEALPAPEFDPAGGSDSDPEVSGTALSVTLSVPGHTDAEITYNIDGGPDQPYSGPIVLDTNGTFTISARATKTGYRDSAVASATYQMNLGVTAEPTFRLADGTEVLPDTYPYDLAVELATATPGATIYYTVADGTTAPAPEVGNPAHEYTGDAIQIAGDETEKTIRAVAKAPGLDVSATAAGTFILRWPRLILDSVGIGSIEIDAFGTSGPEPVQHGTPVAITATPGTDYDFDRWTVVTGTAVIDDATAAQTTVTLTADATVQANFVDENAAAAPTVSGPSLTNDNTPTWTWTPGGGGNGTYRFKLNDGDLSVDATITTATTYAPSTQLIDGSHTLYVQEQDNAGNWSAIGSATVAVDTTAPAQPIVEGVSSGFLTNSNFTFTVNWDETGGTRQYRLTSGGSWQLYTGPVTISNQGEYQISAQQTDAAGNVSALAAEVTGTVDTSAPAQPTIEGVSTGFVSDSVTFTVAWAESGGTREYRLTNGGSWQSYTGEVTISSEGDYEITARQTDAAGNVSGLATTVSGTILPMAPSSLSATAQNADRIDLSWQDNSNTEDGFEVERKEGAGGSYANVTTLSAGTTSYQDTGLDSETTYYYRVRATNSAGDSNWSNEANDTTAQLAAPSGLSAMVISTQVHLTWDNTGELESDDGYQIERDGTVIDAIFADSTSYSDTGVSPGTAYTYRVRAVDVGGASPWSTSVSVTTN